MSNIKKPAAAGGAFKNPGLAKTAQQTAQTPQRATPAAKEKASTPAAEFVQKNASELASGQAATRVGADGKAVDADGNAPSGGALLQARLDATQTSSGPSVNPFPDGVGPEPEIVEPSVNPFPDGAEPEPEIVEPSVNPFPDGAEPEPEIVEPSVNPFPDGAEPEPEIVEPSVNPFPDGAEPEPEIVEPSVNPFPDAAGGAVGASSNDES